MNNNDSDLGSKTVRMFFHLVLRDVILHTSTSTLEALLEPLGCQITFDEKIGVCPCEKQKSTYLIPFLVSKLHVFNAQDIIIPKPNYTGFKVKNRALSSVQKTLAQDIRNAIGKK